MKSHTGKIWRGLSWAVSGRSCSSSACDRWPVGARSTACRQCVVVSFDNLSHEWLVKFIEHRIADRRMLRRIQKWLRAGCPRKGSGRRQKSGSHQRAVASPLLAERDLAGIKRAEAPQLAPSKSKGSPVNVDCEHSSHDPGSTHAADVAFVAESGFGSSCEPGSCKTRLDLRGRPERRPVGRAQPCQWNLEDIPSSRPLSAKELEVLD